MEAATRCQGGESRGRRLWLRRRTRFSFRKHLRRLSPRLAWEGLGAYATLLGDVAVCKAWPHAELKWLELLCFGGSGGGGSSARVRLHPALRSSAAQPTAAIPFERSLCGLLSRGWTEPVADLRSLRLGRGAEALPYRRLHTWYQRLLTTVFPGREPFPAWLGAGFAIIRDEAILPVARMERELAISIREQLISLSATMPVGEVRQRCRMLLTHCVHAEVAGVREHVNPFLRRDRIVSRYSSAAAAATATAAAVSPSRADVVTPVHCGWAMWRT